MLFVDSMELTTDVLWRLTELVSDLVKDGELMLARILRKKVIEKLLMKQEHEASILQPLSQSCPVPCK